MQELERQFKADGGTFEEYKIGDLFQSSTGDFDIQKTHINGVGNYVITAGLTNNGILGKTDVKAKVFEPYTLTVDMFGSPFYRCFKYKMVTHARVFSMKPKFVINDEQGLYLSCSLKYLEKLFGYENMCSWEKIKALPIYLPTLANSEIAFTYMESVTRELQEERIVKLTDYLKENGIENTELSQEEKDAVFRLINGNVRWKEYKIGELFIIHPTNAYKLTNSQIMHCRGKNPVVTNSSVNNGVTGYSCLEPTEKGNMITYSDTTTSEGIFYQPDDFVGYPHVQGLYPKMNMDKWNEKTLLFFVSLFRKSAGGRFDYANKFNRAIASKMIVTLPINSDGEIDWDFMHNLISAESRLAIRGVVEWKDRLG